MRQNGFANRMPINTEMVIAAARIPLSDRRIYTQIHGEPPMTTAQAKTHTQGACVNCTLVKQQSEKR